MKLADRLKRIEAVTPPTVEVLAKRLLEHEDTGSAVKDLTDEQIDEVLVYLQSSSGAEGQNA